MSRFPSCSLSRRLPSHAAGPLCAQPQLPGLAVELVWAEMHGLGILHPAEHKVSLADRWPSSDQLQIGGCLVGGNPHKASS